MTTNQPAPKRRRGRPRGTVKAPTTVELPPGRAGLKVAEVAHVLGISPSQAYVLADRGEFETFHIGTRRLITADSVAAFVDRQIAAEGRPA
jgi:hypothetical protein